MSYLDHVRLGVRVHLESSTSEADFRDSACRINSRSLSGLSWARRSTPWTSCQLFAGPHADKLHCDRQLRRVYSFQLTLRACFWTVGEAGDARKNLGRHREDVQSSVILDHASIHLITSCGSKSFSFPFARSRSGCFLLFMVVVWQLFRWAGGGGSLHALMCVEEEENRLDVNRKHGKIQAPIE